MINVDHGTSKSGGCFGNWGLAHYLFMTKGHLMTSPFISSNMVKNLWKQLFCITFSRRFQIWRRFLKMTHCKLIINSLVTHWWHCVKHLSNILRIKWKMSSRLILGQGTWLWPLFVKWCCLHQLFNHWRPAQNTRYPGWVLVKFAHSLLLEEIITH